MKRSRMSLAAAFLGLSIVATTGCQSDADTDAEGKARKGASVAGGAELVEGWSCESVESCFGFHVGRTRRFERRVGTKSEVEEWVLTDLSTTDGVQTIKQSGGPGGYRLEGDMLWLPMRGQMLPALRFPIVAGDHFEVTVGADQTEGDAPAEKQEQVDEVERVVTMTVSRTDRTFTAESGEEFGPCIDHVASFDRGEGLTVHTTFCEGVGEVSRTIKIPALPNPIEFVLVASNEPSE